MSDLRLFFSNPLLILFLAMGASAIVFGEALKYLGVCQ
jgi:hypothetical protein